MPLCSLFAPGAPAPVSQRMIRSAQPLKLPGKPAMRNNWQSLKAQLEQMIAQNPNDAGLYLD